VKSVVEFFFKEPVTCVSAMSSVICLLYALYIGRKHIPMVEPDRREPEWAEFINKNAEEAKQAKKNLWLRFFAISAIVALFAHILGN